MLLNFLILILTNSFLFNAHAQDIKLTPDWFEFSPNSITGVYTCTPSHVENGDCKDVDQAYYDNLARLTLGSYEIGILTTSDGVEHIAYKGPLSPGSAENLITILSKYPEINSLIISSQGGSEEESYKIANYVKSNKISTWVPPKRMCLSACVAVFLSGEEKNLDGQLGLHMAEFFLQDAYQVKDLKTAKKTINRAVYENNLYMMKRVRMFLELGIPLSVIDTMVALKGEFMVFKNLSDLFKYDQAINYHTTLEKMLEYSRGQDLNGFRAKEYKQLF